MNLFSKSILTVFCFFAIHISAQRGKDGPLAINSNTIVNTVSKTLSVDVTGGASSSITVNNNTGLAVGDLVLIIQMQGATINTASTDSTWGAITAINNCGNNEFQEISSISGNTLTFDCTVKNSYTVAGKTQVIRVMRYSAVTINAGGVLTAPTWNGSTGGVLAVEVQGNTIINNAGGLDMTAKGFRGGAFENQTKYGVRNVVDLWWDAGAYKGESVAGDTAFYRTLGGGFCKGAPANGGGGGNAHNCGGGGGANAGNTAVTWTGH